MRVGLAGCRLIDSNDETYSVDFGNFRLVGEGLVIVLTDSSLVTLNKYPAKLHYLSLKLREVQITRAIRPIGSMDYSRSRIPRAR